MEKSAHRKSPALVVAIVLATISQVCIAGSPMDFGLWVEKQLETHSEHLFGIKLPLGKSADPSSGPIRVAAQPAATNLLLAKGLKADYITRIAADRTDMMVFWPNDHQPTHLFTAVEVFSPTTTSHGKPQPFVQRLNLTTGAVEVVLRGGLGGDPIRRTAWGTLLVGEETSTGAAYEIIDPVNVTEALITDRSIGTVMQSNGTTPENRVAKRAAMGIKAWEGIGLLESGVVYSGDELRPGDAGTDKDGGAIFKFVPDKMYVGSTPISDLATSPLASGRLFALTVSSREASASSFPSYGQGSEVGIAAWVKVNPANARADAAAQGATGYYRPEDLEIDLMYSGGDGVRFCWTNTQRESAKSYGEVLCAVDHKSDAINEKAQASTGRFYLADASNAFATTSVSRFIEGTLDFNSVDNLAFQPGTGNLFVVEDHPNGDVWSCLPDGDDADLKSDGCVKVLSLTDSDAEPTGLFFSKDGKTAYLSIMHSNDTHMTEHNGWPTDDIVKITGFKVKKD